MQTTTTAARACPACGGLGCLCRPRFRAGQVLTETDLNCLEEYVVRKQERHNRYLHGSGVACGLGVACHPCPGWVTVGAGFALGPCGEEIAVPADHPFDVCAAIRACRVATRADWSCAPFTPPCGPTATASDDENWYVTIRYDEVEARGTDCHPCGAGAGGCGCGGAKAAGGKCGCGGAKAAAAPRPAPAAARPAPGCEPNRVCEGYRIEIAPAPPDRPPSTPDLLVGTFVGAVLPCFREFTEVNKKRPPTNASAFSSANAVQAAHAEYRAAVARFLKNHPPGACGAVPELPPVPPAPNEGETAAQFQSRVGMTAANDALYRVAVRLLWACLCEALLPPCPADPCDPRLVLATVTTRGPDCRVVKVCAARGRRQLITPPTLQYWLSTFPLLWATIEQLCCPAPPTGVAVLVEQPAVPQAVGNVREASPAAAMFKTRGEQPSTFQEHEVTLPAVATLLLMLLKQVQETLGDADRGPKR